MILFSILLRLCHYHCVHQTYKPLEEVVLKKTATKQQTVEAIFLAYRKNPKNSDTYKICCNHPKIWTKWIYYRVMSPKNADGFANSVDLDQTAPLSSLIWVLTVCPDLSVQKLRIITVSTVAYRLKTSLFVYKLINSKIIFRPRLEMHFLNINEYIGILSVS